MAATSFASVHINGTSVDSLLDQQRCVIIGAEHLMHALRQAAPHGRDYYVQGDAAYIRAREEYAARVIALQTIINDTELLVEKLFEADPSAGVRSAPVNKALLDVLETAIAHDAA